MCRMLDRPLVTVTTEELPIDALSAYDLTLEPRWRKLVDKYLDALVASAPPGLIIDRIVTIAPAAETLCETAAARRSPLIVVGSHTRRVADLVLGTTALKVTHQAACSVLICRPSPQAKTAPRRLLVALDSTARQRPVLDSAMRLSAATETELVLLRAVPKTLILQNPMLRQPAVDIEALLCERAKIELGQIEREVREDVRCRTRVIVGNPWEVINATAEEENVDLEVIGAHTRSLSDVLLGSTSSRVVHHATRSVLVIKGAGI